MTYDPHPEKFDPKRLIGAPMSREERAAFHRVATGQNLPTSQRHDGAYLNDATERALGLWRAAVLWTVERMSEQAQASSAQQGVAPRTAEETVPLKESDFDAIYDELGGNERWLKNFGYHQFGFAVQKTILGRLATPSLPPMQGAAVPAEPLDVRYEFEKWMSDRGESAIYIGDGLYSRGAATDMAEAFAAGIEVAKASRAAAPASAAAAPLLMDERVEEWECLDRFEQWAAEEGHEIGPRAQWANDKGSTGFLMWIGWQGVVRKIERATLGASPSPELPEGGEAGGVLTDHEIENLWHAACLKHLDMDDSAIPGFARAIEAEVERRCRAQRTNNVFDLDDLADACVECEVSDSKYESLCIALKFTATPAPAPAGGDAWISVDERLPKKYEEVIVWPHPTDYCMTAELYGQSASGNPVWKYGEYITGHGHDTVEMTQPVTHWMPLPQAPSAPVSSGVVGEVTK